MKRLASLKLEAWKSRESRKPLILNGARQVGKTYLLRQFAKSNFARFHYLDLEERRSLHKIFEGDLRPEILLRDLSLALGETIRPQSELIIFDEIQACPRALTSLKYFAEQHSDYYICAAGSLLGISLSESPFPVGNVELLDLTPLSFPEFLVAHERSDLLQCIESREWAQLITPTLHHVVWDYLKLFITTGGLPEVVATYLERKGNQADALFAARATQKTLLSTYLRDIAKHAGKVNSMHLQEVFNSIPAQLGKVLDGSVQRFRFQGIVPGVANYQRLRAPINWLVNAGLAHRIPIVEHAQIPLSSQAKDNIFKLYLLDVGLLGAMADIAPSTMFEFEFGSYKGYLAENFVAQEFLAAGLSALFGWQNNDAEVEFLVNGISAPVPVEVKSGSRYRARSLESYVKRYSPSSGYILSGKERYAAQDGVAIAQQPLYRAYFLGQELQGR